MKWCVVEYCNGSSKKQKLCSNHIKIRAPSCKWTEFTRCLSYLTQNLTISFTQAFIWPQSLCGSYWEGRNVSVLLLTLPSSVTKVYKHVTMLTITLKLCCYYANTFTVMCMYIMWHTIIITATQWRYCDHWFHCCIAALDRITLINSMHAVEYSSCVVYFRRTDEADFVFFKLSTRYARKSFLLSNVLL